MPAKEPQILLTNDDGIDSPGLWTAAEALSELGHVWVIAPREQSSGAGRSMPMTSDGIITVKKMMVHSKEWTVYAVGGSPAQTVQHAIFEIMDNKPDLLVSGINYGANLGTGITVSGTVGAALEGASNGIPSLAVSLDTETQYHLSHSLDIDFSVAGHFTTMFGRVCLENKLDPDVQVLKIEVPENATIDTDWEVTRLSPVRYYLPEAPDRESWDEPKPIGYTLQKDMSVFPKNSDVYAVYKKGVVAVTPISIDLTSRVDLNTISKQLHQQTDQCQT